VKIEHLGDLCGFFAFIFEPVKQTQRTQRSRRVRKGALMDYICGMKEKHPSESYSVITEFVLPNDTNTLGNLMGGRLLHWMDIAAAIAAHRHCGRIVVTASVNNVSFNQPIKIGEIVTINAKVSRSFNSSMEVFMDVWVENNTTGAKKKCNEAIYTFVAVDQLGNPIQVPGIIPETEEEKKRFDGALRRRQLALILAGKMKASDATELKALFV
jgi:acyl-CoA hydrolase